MRISDWSSDVCSSDLQLSQQDPSNPVDNQQMVAQMAQFSSLAGISETNNVLAQISEQLTAQTQLLKDIKAATPAPAPTRSEEHTSELKSLMRISNAVLCLKKKTSHLLYPSLNHK